MPILRFAKEPGLNSRCFAPFTAQFDVWRMLTHLKRWTAVQINRAQRQSMLLGWRSGLAANTVCRFSWISSIWLWADHSDVRRLEESSYFGRCANCTLGIEKKNLHDFELSRKWVEKKFNARLFSTFIIDVFPSSPLRVPWKRFAPRVEMLKSSTSWIRNHQLRTFKAGESRE